jgi:hypothetical protein
MLTQLARDGCAKDVELFVLRHEVGRDGLARTGHPYRARGPGRGRCRGKGESLSLAREPPWRLAMQPKLGPSEAVGYPSCHR